MMQAFRFDNDWITNQNKAELETINNLYGFLKWLAIIYGFFLNSEYDCPIWCTGNR